MISKELSSTPLYGLVLAGGRSIRMGQDKGNMQWHGKAHRYYMGDMLSEICDKVFISCRQGQEAEVGGEFDTITDSIDGKGPLIAIRSAFAAFPNTAWLIVACDLPLLDRATLQQLISERDKSKIATTFKSPFDGLPEPLITIWEPESAEVLRRHMEDGFTCPRKALIRNEERVKIVIATDERSLSNANTPEDAVRVSAILQQQSSRE